VAQNHVIQRLTVELNASDEPTARQRQEEVSHWLKSSNFWQALSQRLDEAVPADVVLRISTLQIEVSASNEADFQTDFIKALLPQIEQTLRNQGEEVLHKQAYLHQTALFFLEYGYLPSAASHGIASEIHHFLTSQSVDIDPIFWHTFRQRISRQPQLLRRLIAFLGREQARKIFCRILHIDTDAPLRWINSLAESETGSDIRKKNDAETAVWQELLSNDAEEILKNETSFKDYFKNKDLKNSTGVTSADEANPPLNSANDTQKETGLFIGNAGLVLLTPFFSQLFQALGWTENHAWKSPDFQHQAVRLLDYLAKAPTDSQEYDWPLNKLLCGVPLETVIEPEPPLTSETLETADELLKAVIGYWTVLKNTSAAGLRQLFLQREGRLRQPPGGNDWYLLVARKTEDVLLERIPWSFSVIRLPWMESILFVEW